MLAILQAVLTAQNVLFVAAVFAIGWFLGKNSKPKKVDGPPTRYPSSGKRPSDFPDLRSRKQNQFRADTFPPAYPNGWYKICDSADVPAGGQPLYRQYLGQHFVIFRGDKNKRVCVLDAFCPHLGANLAIGGTVKDDCLKCPFHAWEFSSAKGQEGKVANVPYYEGKVPKSANARAWPVEERFGMVLLWFDAEEREPTWHMPRYPDVEDADPVTGKHKMVLRGSMEGRDVGMHVQDWAENGVDYSHFDVLHSRLMVPWTRLTLPRWLAEIDHDVSFSIDKENKHIAYLKNSAVLKFFGKKFESTRSNATVHFIGPSGLVYMEFVIPKLGKVLLLESHTPRAPMLLKTQFRWYSTHSVSRFLASYIVGNWWSQWTNDLEIWENKIYRRPPVILKGDGPVNKLRRWYSQFYSENSRKMGQGNTDLSW